MPGMERRAIDLTVPADSPGALLRVGIVTHIRIGDSTFKARLTSREEADGRVILRFVEEPQHPGAA